MQPPIRNRQALFCMTDFTQEFNETSKNKVRMRIFFNQRATYIEQHSIALIFENKRHEAFQNKKDLLR